jgi:hypothetical protein
MNLSHVPALGRLRCALALAALHAIAGCDAQAPDDYRGEPLLSITGKVELALNREDRAGLKPALVFVRDGVLRIVDVEVSGEFPAEFTLDVYEPPPEELIAKWSSEGPRLVPALIGAVPEDHPEEIYSLEHSEVTGDICLDEDGECLRQTEEWCTPNRRCYSRTTECPYYDAPPEECIVTELGDASLLEPPWRQFAGLSQNYIVLYLAERSEPDTEFTETFGGEPLDPGYHLFEVREPTAAEIEAVESCEQRALELAVERTNAEYGTSYSAQEFELGLCYPCEEGLIDTFHREQDEAKEELNCGSTHDGEIATEVKHPESEFITIQVGPVDRPFFW